MHDDTDNGPNCPEITDSCCIGQEMSVRECHHDSTWHDYIMDQDLARTLRIDRVCDRCDKTLQTFWANAEEAA